MTDNTVTIETVGEHYLNNAMVRNAVMKGMDKDKFICLLLDQLKETQDALTDVMMHSVQPSITRP